MSKWQMVKLGEVCEIARGGSPRPIDKYITDDENGVNWIKIGDTVEGQKLITSTKQKIIHDGIKKSRQVYKGDFLLTNSMSFGKPFILGIDGCIHDGWLVISDKNNVFSKDYLYYILSSQTLYNQFKLLAVGGVVNNLNSDIVRKVQIPLPPLEEQQKIAKNLDLASDLVKLYKTKLEELDKLIQSVFYDMFGDPVTNEKGWECKIISHVTDVATGSTPSRKTPDYYNGNIAWIKTGELSQGYINTSIESISQKAIDESNCKIFPINTILIAMYGQGKTRGSSGILKIKASTNQACAAILPNKGCESEFLYRQIVLRYDELRALGRGGNQENLNLSMVKSLKVILPPLPLQQKFADIVTKIEEQKTEVNKALKDAEMLYNSLMQEYFE